MKKKTNYIINNFFLMFIFLLTIECTHLKIKTRNNNRKISDKDLPKVSNNTKYELPYFSNDNIFKNALIRSKSTCNYINCASPYGQCIDPHRCVCYQGYVDEPYLLNNKIQFCLYKQKSQLIAFLLELILFFGAGHLYSNRFILAFLKFMFILLSLFIYNQFYEENGTNGTF